MKKSLTKYLLILVCSLWIHTLYAQVSVSLMGAFPNPLCEGGKADLKFVFTGTPPFYLKYSDGTTTYTLNNIQASDLDVDILTIPVNPSSSKGYFPVSVTDGSNNSGTVYGYTWLNVTPINFNTPVGSNNNASVCSGASVTVQSYYVSCGSIQWQRSLNNGNSYDDISGATALSYTDVYTNPTTSLFTYYLRMKITNGTVVKYTQPVLVPVKAPLVAGIPSISSTEICAGDVGASIGVGLSGYTGGTVTWEKSVNNPDNFVQATYTNAANASINNLNSNGNYDYTTYYFRAVVTDGLGCPTVRSAPISAKVYAKPQLPFVSGSLDLKTCDGATIPPITLTPNSTYTPNYTYTWFNEQTAGNPVIVASSSQNSYQPPAFVNAGSTYKYQNFYAYVKNGACSTYTYNSLSVTIYPTPPKPTITTTSATEVCSDNVNNGLFLQGGNYAGSASVGWQKKVNGGTTTDIGGATSFNYNTGALSSQSLGSVDVIEYSLKYYYSGIGCTASVSDPLKVTIYRGFFGNAPYQNPVTVHKCSGDQGITLTPTVSSFAKPQWEMSLGGGPYAKITDGGNAATYTTPVIDLTGTNSDLRMYRVYVENGVCRSPNSNPVNIFTYPKPIVGTITSPASEVCNDIFQTPTIQKLTLNYNQSLNYSNTIVWQKHLDVGSNYYDFATAVTTVNSDPLTGAYDANSNVRPYKYFYKAKVYNSGCSVVSPEYVVTVYNSPYMNGKIYATNNAILNGGNITINGDGARAAQYQWQIKRPGETDFSDITGATSRILTLSNVTTSTLRSTYVVRLKMLSYICAPVYSNEYPFYVYKKADEPEMVASSFMNCQAANPYATIVVQNAGLVSPDRGLVSVAAQKYDFTTNLWNTSQSITGFDGNTNAITLTVPLTITNNNENRVRVIMVFRGSDQYGNPVNLQSFYQLPSIYYYQKVPAVPSVPTGNTSLCADVATSVYSVSAVAQATSYVWGLTPSTAGAVIGNGTSATVNWNTAFSGSAVLTCASSNTCGNSTPSSLSITRKPLPNASFSGLSASYCQGNAATTLVPVTTGGIFSGSNTNLIIGSSSVTYNPAIAGTSQVIYTLSGANGCANSSAQTTTVNALPIVDAGPDISVCSGKSITLTGSGNAAQYTWDKGVVNGVAFTPTNTTYTVTGQSSQGCTAKDQVDVTLRALPTVSFAGLASSYCFADAPATLNGNPAGGVFDIDEVVITNFSPSFAGNGLHAVKYTYTDPLTNCTNSTQQYVTVNPMPQDPSVTLSQNTVCSGKNFTVSMLSVAGHSVFVSAYPAGFTVLTGGGNPNATFLVLRAGTQSGDVEVTIRNNTTGCQKILKYPVVVNPTPAAPTVTDRSLCSSQTGPGITVSLKASGALPGSVYQWYDVNQTLLYTSSGYLERDYSVPSEVATTYYVSVVNQNGSCESTRIPAKVLIAQTPSAPVYTLSPSGTVCPGSESSFTIQHSPTDYFLSWSVPAGSTINSTYNSQVTELSGKITWGTQTGDVVINALSLTNSACSSKVVIPIIINPLPVSPTVTNNNQSGPGTVTMTASGIPAGSYEYRWYDVSKGGTVLATGSSFTTNIVVAKTFYVSIADLNTGCESIRASVAVGGLDYTVSPLSTTQYCPGGVLKFNLEVGKTYAPNTGFVVGISNPSGVYSGLGYVYSALAINTPGVYPVSFYLSENLPAGNLYKVRVYTPDLNTYYEFPQNITIGKCGALYFNSTENKAAYFDKNMFVDIGLTEDFSLGFKLLVNKPVVDETMTIFSNWSGSKGLSVGTINYATNLQIKLGQNSITAPLAGALIDGGCHYLTLVRSNNGTKLEVYLDGAVIASSAVAATILNNESNNGILGRNNSLPLNSFNGKLHQMNFWNSKIETGYIQSALGNNDYWAFQSPASTYSFMFNEYDNDYILEEHTGEVYAHLGTINGSIDPNNPSRELPNCLQASGIKGLSFSGTQRATVPNNNAHSFGTGDFTVEAWVNLTSTVGNAGAVPLVSNRTNGSFTGGMMFTTWNGGQQLLLQINGQNTLSSSFASIHNGTCNHVAVSRKNNVISFYLNGVKLTAQNNLNGTVSNTNPLTIGRDNYDQRTMIGSINEVRIWTGARSDAEILNNMTTAFYGNALNNLVGYYRFEESGQTILDDGPLALHGNLGATALVETNDAVRVNNACYSNEKMAYDDFPAPLSVDSLLSDLSIAAYPNPFESAITLEVDGLMPGETGTIEITNLQGLLVDRRELTSVKMELELTLPSGIYVVTIRSGNRTAVEKIVKLN